MNRDDLFDIEIKDKIRKEVNTVPDSINNIFDSELNKCLRKRKLNYKKVAGICAVVLASTIALSITMATYAADIPVLRNIFDTFKSKKYENYDKYASDINVSKEDKGIKITINKVLYDGIDLQLLYTVETTEPIDYSAHFVNEKIKINGKEVFSSGVSTGEIQKENVSVGLQVYNINSKNLLPNELKDTHSEYTDIPEEFVLNLKIDKISYKENERPIKGNWEFNIPVNIETTKSEVKEIDVNINLENLLEELKVDKIITSPINTAIQTSTTYLGNKSLDFMVIDTAGNELEFKERNYVSYEFENGKEATYSTYKFKELPEETNWVTVIPYVIIYPDSGGFFSSQEGYEITESESPTKLEVPLNLNGSTKLKTKDGSYYGEITKVEILDNKTNIYYKPTIGDFNIFEQIYNTDINYETSYPIDNYYDNEVPTTKYLHETGEYLIQFTKPLDKENYTIVYYDYSKQKIVYYDEAFTIDVSK